MKLLWFVSQILSVFQNKDLMCLFVESQKDSSRKDRPARQIKKGTFGQRKTTRVFGVELDEREKREREIKTTRILPSSSLSFDK